MRARGRFLLAVLVPAAAFALGAFTGFRAGTADTLHSLVGEGDRFGRATRSLRYAVGLESFNGIYGQDLWVINTVHPGIRDGYFVDIGSADGEEISNTRRLEDEGWTGICIDPFPRNMQHRSCKTFAEAVDSQGGRTVKFQSPGDFAGGIVDYAGWWVSDSDKRKAVELKTATIGDILERANAPEYIHYLNIDIEGAEYEALRVFPFDRYRIGAITVEHNNIEDRRIQLRDLLESHGYRLEWAIRDQDWYVPKSPQPTQ
jgi:FkbM family methyltransferase